MALRGAVGVVVILLALAGGAIVRNRVFRQGAARAIAASTSYRSDGPGLPSKAQAEPRSSPVQPFEAVPGRAAVNSETPAELTVTPPRLEPSADYSGVFAALDEGKYEQAASLLKGLSDRQRATPAYWFATGCLHYKLRKLDLAAEAYMHAITMRPDFSAAYACLGDVYSYQNQHGKALETYRKALKLNPREARAYCGEGNVYGKQGQYEKAVAVFDRGIAIDPQDPELLCRKGLYLGAARRYDEAEKAYQAALKINDQRVDTYLYMGESYLVWKRLDRAIATYHKALAIQPDNAMAYSKLGVASYRAGDTAAARAAWRSAQRFDPDGQWGRAARSYLKDPGQALAVQ